MDALLQIIQSLDRTGVSEFTAFIHRLKQKQNRKDLELFLLLRKYPEWKQNDILKQLYPNGNKDAYHALRKKLLKHLTDFIFFKQLRDDDATETPIVAMMGLARYLKDNGIYKAAWKYFKKAEQMAVNAEQHALANQVMRWQLEMPLDELKQSLTAVLERKKRYLQMALEDDKADTAYKIIQYHLQHSKTQLKGPDMRQVIESTVKEYELDQALSRRPSIVYRLVSIARSAAKAEKNYFDFEPLVLSMYNKLETEGQQSSQNKVYIVRLQYILAHTYFRNKKFDQSLIYLKILRESLRTVIKTEYIRLLPRFTLLYGALQFFTGHIKEAIRVADATFMERLKLRPEDTLNLKLNQAIYHFFNKNYKVAAKVMASIGHSNAWCAKVAGIEWVVKKDLLDIFIQFELGHYELASNRVRAMLRQRDWYDNMEQMERVEVFIKLVGQIVEQPEVAETEAFYNRVEEGFDWLPIEQEDLHASVFYAWLKGKIVGKGAYEVLLELIEIY